MGCFPGGDIIPVPTPLEGPPDKVTRVPKLSGQKEQGRRGSLQGRGRAGPTALRLGGLVSQGSARTMEQQAEGWEDGQRAATCKTENG